MQADAPAAVKFVLDGGALLQQIPWEKRISWAWICERYLGYVVKKYSDATVVFDGNVMAMAKQQKMLHILGEQNLAQDQKFI